MTSIKSKDANNTIEFDISQENLKKYFSQENNVFEEKDEGLNVDALFANIIAKNAQSDVNIKNKYAPILLKMLSLQLFFINLLFIGYGLGWLKYSEEILKTFINDTFLEIAASVFFIVRYIFTDRISSLIEKINRKG